MQRILASLIALGTLAASTAARAQSPPAPPPFVPVQPVGPEPTAVPPPPTSFQGYGQTIQAPEPVYHPAPVAAPAPAGQWVYTQQYGWLWMPYGPQYTAVTSPTVAYGYVYYPAHGWRWVSAPWVIGVGRAPHWGRLGPRHYAWHHARTRPPAVHVQSRGRQVVAPRAAGRVVHVDHRGRHR